MILMRDREATDDQAVAGDIVDIGDALATATGAAIIIGRTDLAIAIGADGQDELFRLGKGGHAFGAVDRRGRLILLPRRGAEIVVAFLGGRVEALEDRERNDFVAILERHAAHAGRGAALEFAHVSGGEADRAALAGGEQNVILFGQQRNADQAIVAAFVEAHRELAVAGHIGEGVHAVAAHGAVRSGEHDVQFLPAFLVLGQRQHGLDGFARCQRQQVDHRPATGGGAALGQAPDLEAIDLARGREEQHRRVRRGDEQFGDGILILGRHARTALAATALGAEAFERGALDIALHGDGDDHLLALDQILVIDAVGGRGDDRHARRGKFALDRLELFAHHGIELHPVTQDGEIFGDGFGQFGQFLADLVTAERGQAVEAQVEDGADLHVAELVALAADFGLDRLDQGEIGRDLADRPFARQQRFAGSGRAGRTADDLHHLVEVGDRDDQAQQYMGAVARLVQLELGAAGDDLFAELDEGFDDVAQAEQFRAAATDRQHVGGEARLGWGVAPQLVEDDVRGGVALQVHDDAYAFAARFVTNVADALDPLVLGGFGDLFDQAALADLIGDGGENDRATVAAAFLYLVPGAHQDRAATGMIGVAGARLA